MADRKGTGGHSESIYKLAEKLRLLEESGGDLPLLAQAIGNEIAKELERIRDHWAEALPDDLKGMEP